MGLLLGFVLLFVIVLALLLGMSVGVAFLLHWLLPAVGLEMALLIAVLAAGQALLILARLAGVPGPSADDAEGDYERAPIVILDREVALPRRRRHRT